jgi:hypothetical protein
MNQHLLGSALGALITATAIIPPDALAPGVSADPTPSPAAVGMVEIVPGNGFYWLRGYSYAPGQPPQLPPVPVGAAGVVYDVAGRCIGRFEDQQFVFLDADSVQCVGIPPAPPVVYTSQRGQG